MPARNPTPVRPVCASVLPIRRSATKRGFGHFHHTEYNIACAYALMNKKDLAIEWLRKSAAEGFNCYPLFERDANLANLKSDPRFLDLLAAEKKRYESFREKYATSLITADKL